MAIGIHVVNTAFLRVDPATRIPIKGDDKTVSIKQHLLTESQHVVLPDTTVPNSIGYPSVPAYLKLEAASDFVLKHLDQNTIITYNQTDLNGA